MENIINMVSQYTNQIYYILAIIGFLYAFYTFISKRIKNSDWFNLIRLIKETPENIVEIKNGQTEIFKEIKLQGKLVNCILDTLELAQIVCDTNGECIKVNSKWISLTGLSQEDAHGHNWLISVHPEDRQSVQKKWHNMIAYNTPFEEVFRYQHRITEIISTVKCTAIDVEDESGKRVFILGLSRVLE